MRLKNKCDLVSAMWSSSISRGTLYAHVAFRNGRRS